MVKIVVFTPESHTDIVCDAMGEAGAGHIGNYSHCFFLTKGHGRFTPGLGTNPYVGEVGKREEAVEIKIETVCPREKLQVVIEAVKEVHPYEEIAFDVYPLEQV